MNLTSVKSSGALCNVPTKYVKIVESSEAAHITEHMKLNEAMGNHNRINSGFVMICL